MAARSRFRSNKSCYVCAIASGLHLHHIFYGTANRRQSEKYGCTAYLCGRHHNLSNEGVHFNRELDLRIKQECERWCLHEYGWTIEDFIREFGRNYLDDEADKQVRDNAYEVDAYKAEGQQDNRA